MKLVIYEINNKSIHQNWEKKKKKKRCFQRSGGGEGIKME